MIMISCKAQNKESKENNIKLSLEDLFVVDTINIDSPLLIKFEDEFSNYRRVLIQKEFLKPKDSSNCVSFNDYITSKEGCLFFPPNRFLCLLNNFIYKNESNTKQNIDLQDKIRGAENDTIWVFDRKNITSEKEYLGWKYREIYSRRFLLCLVKGSVLKLCESKDEIPLEGNDNLYFKVLVPITWDK